MAKRKSMNKRQSRSSRRSSFLDPNSELFEEEEPFWWNKLSKASKSRSEYNTFNETSKFLNVDSQYQSMGENNQWWEVLQTSDSSKSEERIKAAREETQNKYVTSDTDEEENNLPLRERKIQIRKRSDKKTSNRFKKVLDDIKSSKSSESDLPQNSITKNTKDTPSSKKLLQELDYTEIPTNQIKNISSKSIDQSQILNKVLKSKHNIFSKKSRKKNYNALEYLLKTGGDSDNKSEKTETSYSDSSAKLMNKNNTSKQNVFDKSKDKKSDMSFPDASAFKKHITNPETLNYNENDLIPQNRTNSSISLLSSSEGSTYLEFIPELIDDNSNKNASKNISTNLKKSATVDKISDSTMHSTTTSTKFRNSVPNEKIESRETENKNEASLSSVRHINTPNKSKMKNSTNLRTTINALQRESMDERNLSPKITDKSDKFEKMSTNMSNNAIKDTSNDEISRKNISTLQKSSIHNISDKNEENLLKTNNKTSINDLDINAPSLKQTSSRIMNDVNDAGDKQTANYIDHTNRKTSNVINTDHQNKIDKYFNSTTIQVIPPIGTITYEQYKIMNKNNKENGQIKKTAKLETIDVKLRIKELFAEIIPTIDKKQMKEKMEELRQDMGKTKVEKKKIIHEAYIVNGKVYKRPKLPRPKVWATDRLYKFLWKMMKPKYELFTRVRSEKFVKELSAVVTIITKTKEYKDYKTLLNTLMENMAKHGIIRTPNDFYDFCYDYLPYDFRVKVVPMLIPGKGRNIPYNPKTLNEPILKN